MRTLASILLAAAVSPLSAYAGMYGDPVINLDAKSFKKAMATEHAAMVAFVAPWCGHCKALGPEFTAAANSLSPLIPFYAIDCDESANKPLCGEHQVQGFPTIKAFPRAGKGAAREYRGERKKGALVEYARELVPDRVKKLRTDDGVEKVLGKFLDEKPDLPHALLIHPSTPSIPFLWKVLGHRLSSQMLLGYIRDTKAHEVLSSLGIYDAKDTTRDATRAVVWQPGAEKGELVEYDGVMKFNGLLEWLQNYLPAAGAGKGKGKSAKAKKDSKSEKAKAKKAEEALQAEKARDASGTKDAPPAEPEPVAEEAVMQDTQAGVPADPQVEEEVSAGDTGDADAPRTVLHEEL